MATAQPFPSSPSVLATGTRASSKKTSAKPVSPSSCAMGRTVIPSVARGTRMNVSPRWRSACGSVRKIPNIQSANAPREHHVF
jgi:hypothetical protein